MKYIISKYTSESQIDKTGTDCFVCASNSKILYFAPNKYRFKAIKPYKGSLGFLWLDLKVGDNVLVTYQDIGFVDGGLNSKTHLPSKDYEALENLEEIEITDNDYLSTYRSVFGIATHENLKLEKYNTNFVRDRAIQGLGSNKLCGLETELEFSYPNDFNGNDDACNYQAQKWIPKQEDCNWSHQYTKYFDFINFEKSKQAITNFIPNSFNNALKLKNVDKVKISDKTEVGFFANLSKCYLIEGIDRVDVSNVRSFKLWFCATSPYELPLSKWNVSSGTTFEEMFISIKAVYKIDLSNWKFTNIENISFIKMFKDSVFGNLYLKNWDFSNVNIQNCKDMFLNSKIDNIQLGTQKRASFDKFKQIFQAVNFDMSKVHYDDLID